MVVVFLAEGFEEVEALAPVDVMRRAGLAVKLAGVTGREVTGSHGICVQTDMDAQEVDATLLEAMVLPGGLPGTHNLEASPAVQRCIDSCVAQGKLVAAICAAPSILAHKGLLAGKNATAFPGFQKDLQEGGALLSESYVVRDGQFLTARGMGVATQFGLALVEALSPRRRPRTSGPPSSGRRKEGKGRPGAGSCWPGGTLCREGRRSPGPSKAACWPCRSTSGPGGCSSI